MAGTIQNELTLNILQAFQEIDEQEFLPETLTAPINSLMTACTFYQLNELATRKNRKVIESATDDMRRFERHYDDFKTLLNNTPNVFSGSVDFI